MIPQTIGSITVAAIREEKRSNSAKKRSIEEEEKSSAPVIRNGDTVRFAVRRRGGSPGTTAGATDARPVRGSATGPSKQDGSASVPKS